MVEVGSLAPDFTIPDENNQPVTLSKELGQGPVVLNFYVFDFTGVCHGQLCALRDRFDQLKGLGAKVFGLSTDSPHSHRAWKAQERFQYPLLSDWNKEVSRKYGVQYDDFGPTHLRGVSKRSVFVLDRDGVVRWKWVTEDPKVPPDINKVIEAVQRVKQV